MLNQSWTIHLNLYGISKRAEIFVLVSVDSIRSWNGALLLVNYKQEGKRAAVGAKRP